jgi:lauroyl/myristoyl acyltransferase
VTTETREWWHGFAVQGIHWRRFVDWAILNVPSFFHPLLIWIATFLFFFIAAPAREALVGHLGVVLPNSWRFTNYFRALRVFANFGWMLTDAAVHRLRHCSFACEFEGEGPLEKLAVAEGAIVLTAHMGNYDLGAAMFAQKYHRQIRIVRAPEPDALAAQHMDLALHQAGVERVDYSDHGTAVAFDLLNALRAREIISIQGDRVVGERTRPPVRLFGRSVFLPTGPFVLSLASETPIFPLFIVRIGYRKYRVIACEPIVFTRGNGSRDEQIAQAMAQWSAVLEKTVRLYWSQWYGFIPLF